MPTGRKNIRLSGHAMPLLRCITIGRLPALPLDFLLCCPSHMCLRKSVPPLSDTQELANKGRLPITDDDSSVTRGGFITVLDKTHWMGLFEPSSERDMDLQHSRNHIVRYWTGTPDQPRQTNRLCRRMRVGAAQRELSRFQQRRTCWRPATLAPRAQSGFAASATQ